ncbi:hypothetical protein NOF55_09170 [Rhizobiaceae bacterium BDR2-2]|uniref:Uncharacterized protein n=1 Tax=Ectorhizobium quercum TaxID=2965071 RepID=A0AAE3N038_9HYPH|nr:hypothetical protein [Ectorhizobium quercum]MCX8997274.1 hypothetical protein [Ectorhizobium quercum]
MSTSEIERLLDIGRRAPSVPAGLAAGYLPSFESVVAVTSSTAAVMTTVGVYESARLSPKTGQQRRGLHVHFNQDRTAEAVIAHTDREARLPPAIRFLDHAGGVGHTTYLTSPSDLWALGCLSLSATTPRALPRETVAMQVPPSGARKAPRSVDRQVVPHVLAYLAALRFPLAIVLSNASCIHCDDGPLEDVSQAGDLVFVRMARTTLSFDPVLIGG